MYIDDLPAGFLFLFIYSFCPLPAVVAGGPSSPASGAAAPTQDLWLRHETSVPGEPQRSLRTPQGDQW
jgi:hypothetical protein